jgi:hypothetical protein
MKRPFLCVYDYGQGGVWLLIDARTPVEIETTYPMLKVFADRPDWMKETEKAKCIASIEKSGQHYDVDEKPSGWLKQLCEKKPSESRV